MSLNGSDLSRRAACLVLIAVFSCALGSQEALAAKKSQRHRVKFSAKAAVIVDARSGKVLFSKNAHLKLPPASTTKLMTVLIALERLPMDKRIVISANAANVSPSRAGLTAGAEYTTRALVLASLVASANDAAVALAEAIAGSEPEFAELMNEKARKIGMRDTHFVNASGLPYRNDPDAQYTTAHDLTLLMRRALKDKRVDQIMGYKKVIIGGTDGKRITLWSHNKMLFKEPGFVKGKTGWTFASRHTFVGTDYAPRKEIAFAMLHSTQPWIDIRWLANQGNLLKNR